MACNNKIHIDGNVKCMICRRGFDDTLEWESHCRENPDKPHTFRAKSLRHDDFTVFRDSKEIERERS